MLYVNILNSLSSKRIGTLSWTLNVIEFLNQKKVNVKYLVTKDSGLEKTFIDLGVNKNQIIALNIKNNPFRHALIQYYLFKYTKPSDYIFTPYVGGLYFNINRNQIIVIHDLAWFNDTKKYTFFERFILKLSTKLLVLNCFKIITVSEWSKSDIQETLKINVNAVIPNTITDPINRDIRSISAKLFNKKFANLNHDKYVLSIGTVIKGKNYELTAKIFEDTLAKQGFKYIIIGDYDIDSELAINIKSQYQNTILSGYIPDEAMFYLLKNCRGYVNLSFYEGFGIPLLDAIYYNKPALISNTSALIDLALSYHIKLNPYDEDAIRDGFLNFLDKVVDNQESINLLEKYSHSNVNQLLSNFFMTFLNRKSNIY